MLILSCPNNFLEKYPCINKPAGKTGHISENKRTSENRKECR